MSLNMLMPEMMSYAASCMTLLHEFSIRQTQPFAAVCTNISQQSVLVERCKVFSNNRKYSFKTFMADEADIVSKCKDDILFLQYAQDIDEHFLPQFCDILGEGYFESEPLNCLVCILFNGFIPDEITEYFSIIIPNQEVVEFIETQNQWINVQQMIINQRGSEGWGWSFLCEILKQKKYLDDVPDDIKDAELLYAAASIKALLKNTPKCLKSFYDIVNSKIELSEDSHDRSDLSELFVEKLYQEVKLICPIIPSHEASCKMKQYAMYDDDYYYFPENLMSEIIKKMNQYAGATEIKRALMTDGYLEVQGKDRNYYTQKVKVGDKRYRFYIFWRNRIDRIGEITLLQFCCLEGEG